MPGPARYSQSRAKFADCELHGAGSNAELILVEGDSAQDAPTEARYFRAELTLPAGAAVQLATLRVTADDQCAAFLNGHPILFAIGFVILTLPVGVLFTTLSRRMAVKR